MISRRTLNGLAVAGLLAGCGRAPAPASDALTIDATAVPQAEILRRAARLLRADHVTLDIRTVSDYDQPNEDVASGRVALNFFETLPYLNEWNRRHGTRLEALVPVHVEPLAGYSKRFHSLAKLPSHATVAIADDPSNAGRALRLLAAAGIIKLRPTGNTLPGVADVLPGRRQIVFQRAPAATLAGLLRTVDLVMINTNFALAAGLDPARDALVIEGKNSPFANYLVSLPAMRHDPRVRKLVAALRSADVRAFILRRYQGAVIPSS